MADKFKTFFLLICFCCLPAQFHAQSVEPIFDEIPAAIPNCVFQDSQGFIWFGAQDGLTRYDGYELKRYAHIPFDSTSLSNNWVLDIEEDNHGNLWVGTYGGGLNHFDVSTGKFTRYMDSPEDQNDIGSNFIGVIVVNKDGSLWLGTQTIGFVSMKMDDRGIAHFTHYSLADDIPAEVFPSRNSVLAMFKDHQNMLWLGTGDGLVQFNPENGEMIEYCHDPNDPFSISHNSVRGICEDDSGNIWIATGSFFGNGGGGLNRYDRRTGKFSCLKYSDKDPGSISSDCLTSLLIDHTGVMWIGTLGSYLNSIPLNELYSPERPRFRHHTNSSYPVINSLYEDHYGNIWIAPWNMKVYKYDRQQKPFYLYRRTDDYPNSLTSSGINTFFIDHSGCLWFGTSGLDKYDPETGKYSHYYPDPGNPSSLSDDWVTGMQEDKEGKLWISTRNGGINIFNPGDETFEHIYHDPQDTTGLLSNSIRFLEQRENGDLWISTTSAGIQLLQKQTGNFHPIDFDTVEFEELNVNAIIEDRDGRLWVGTGNLGLYGVTVTDYKITDVVHYRNDITNPNSLCYDRIDDIIQPQITDTNSLWIATPVGLDRLDMVQKTFSHYGREHGLSNDFILKLLEDNNGNIWCATADGIAVYNMEKEKITSYGKGDGLPHTTFGGSRQNADKGPDGKLYFSSGRGTIGFDPEKIIDNPNVPPIRLIDFKIFHKSVKLDTAVQFKKTIRLAYNQNVFSFDFVALNFTNPEKNQYAYKMEGFHDDWIYCGTERTASFTNLDPGEYVFHVKGSNNHSVWNEEGASIRVVITPPWWRTGWAYFAYTLLLGTFLIGTVRFEVRRRQRKIESRLQRERELRELQAAEHKAVVAELQRKTAEAQQEAEKEHMRSRIASDLHDEIGSNLSSIALISQVLEDKYKVPKPMKMRLREIPRIARLTAESMRDIVWFINPENDDMGKLLAKMRDTANLMLETVDFTFTAPETSLSLETDLDFRRNLYLFYKECLQNIIKHSQARKVEIKIMQSGKCLQLQVVDNGVGFDTSQEYSGSGLKNLQRRAADMGGEMQIVTGMGKGTTITLTVKMGIDFNGI